MKHRTRDWLHRFEVPSPAACVLLAAAAAVFVWQCFLLGNVLIDDAYITFSFSKNLARGNGPVYSHGIRAEGYSNFLWMLLVALPLTVAREMDPVWSARVVGSPFVLLLAWGTYRLTFLGTASQWVAATAVLMLACATDFATAYLSGLETLSYTAFFVCALALLLSSWRSENSPARVWAPWFALGAALTRIDGFLVLGLVLGCQFLHDVWTRRGIEPVRFLKWAGPALAVYALWFAWRYFYYGLPLPSTYYAKALIPSLLPDRGFSYVRDELTSSALYLAAFGATWLLARGRTWVFSLVVAVVGQLGYVVKVGGDWMPFGRFVMPIVPLLVVLLVAGALDAVRTVRSEIRGGRPLAYLAAAALLVTVAGRLDHRWWNDGVEVGKIAFIREQMVHVTNLKRAARLLNVAVPSGRRLVTDYAGIVGYYTDAAVIDMWGLATPMIAQRGGVERVAPIYGRTCPECYPELNPEFFHVMVPLLRPEPAFRTPNEVIENVWQTDTIGRYIDFLATYAIGRIQEATGGEALYFLEKRSPEFSAGARTVGSFKIDYPFESVAPAPS